MQRLINWLGRIGLVLGILTLAFLALQGPGYQAGWFDLGQIFRKHLSAISITGGIAALSGLIALLGVKVGGGKTATLGLLGLLAGGFAAAVPLAMKSKADSLPRIHDITTDIHEPPQYVAIAPLRAKAPNPVSYDSEISQQQIEAYPEVKPLTLDASLESIHAAALAQLMDMGLEIVAAPVSEGRIEATATTRWFGFQDDVVVRLKPGDSGVVVDVRSKSRIGLSDLGVNASRINAFLDGLRARI